MTTSPANVPADDPHPAATLPTDGNHRHPPLAPILFWLLLQFIALAIPALRIPLYAKPGATPELFAFAAILLTQIIVVTLLFPWLLRDAQTATAVALSGIPMLWFAGSLSAVSQGSIVVSAAGATAWIIALVALRSAVPSSGSLAILVAMLGTLVLSPLLLRGVGEMDVTIWLTPTASIGRSGIAMSWKPFTASMILTIIAATLHLFRHRRE